MGQLAGPAQACRINSRACAGDALQRRQLPGGPGPLVAVWHTQACLCENDNACVRPGRDCESGHRRQWPHISQCTDACKQGAPAAFRTCRCSYMLPTGACMAAAGPWPEQTTACRPGRIQCWPPAQPGRAGCPPRPGAQGCPPDQQAGGLHLRLLRAHAAGLPGHDQRAVRGLVRARPSLLQRSRRRQAGACTRPLHAAAGRLPGRAAHTHQPRLQALMHVPAAQQQACRWHAAAGCQDTCSRLQPIGAAVACMSAGVASTKADTRQFCLDAGAAQAPSTLLTHRRAAWAAVCATAATVTRHDVRARPACAQAAGGGAGRGQGGGHAGRAAHHSRAVRCRLRGACRARADCAPCRWSPPWHAAAQACGWCSPCPARCRPWCTLCCTAWAGSCAAHPCTRPNAGQAASASCWRAGCTSRAQTWPVQRKQTQGARSKTRQQCARTATPWHLGSGFCPFPSAEAAGAVQVDLSQPDFWAAVDSTGHASRTSAWLGGFTEARPARCQAAGLLPARATSWAYRHCPCVCCCGPLPVRIQMAGVLHGCMCGSREVPHARSAPCAVVCKMLCLSSSACAG